MRPTANGAAQETKHKNLKINLPSTKQEREKEQNNLRVFSFKNGYKCKPKIGVKFHM